MTTFYHYDGEGLVRASSADPVLQNTYYDNDTISPWSGQNMDGPYFMYPTLERPDPFHTEEYCFQEAAFSPEDYHSGEHPDCGVFEQRHRSAETYDSHNSVGNSSPGFASSLGYAGWAAQSGQYRPYPDPEDIRHQHTLYSLLPYIQPERKVNALNGPTIDIIEQDTRICFAYAVPKKLLVLFLGRKIVTKFMRTVEREDNVNWRGAAVRQELCLPRGQASKISVRILIAWMIRACQRGTMGDMRAIQMPENVFAMCSLAQTMALLGLHKDALRLDVFISQRFSVQPIFASELETLWNCLGPGNRYVYAAIKIVGERLKAHEAGSKKALARPEEIVALLERNSVLSARVGDSDLNERHRPNFGTEWFKKLEDCAETASERCIRD